MTPPQDPFDSSDIEQLAAVDALLDRLGSRAPSPDDLDDPVVAALALMAAEIDLDAVPVDTTRALLTSARSEVEPPPVAATTRDEAAGLVIDLRDGRAGDAGPDAGLDDADGVPPAPVRAHSAVGGSDQPREPRRRGRRPEPGPVAMAPPRSLPRTRSTRPGPGHPESRTRRLRPVTAGVIVLATIMLGSGVSAALTGGRSVNPLIGIQQVVAELTGNRTAAQQRAFDAAQQQLREAKAAVRDGQYAKVRSLLGTIDLNALAPEDKKAVRQQIAEVKASARA